MQFIQPSKRGLGEELVMVCCVILDASNHRLVALDPEGSHVGAWGEGALEGWAHAAASPRIATWLVLGMMAHARDPYARHVSAGTSVISSHVLGLGTAFTGQQIT